jgi:hypothetical protein
MKGCAIGCGAFLLIIILAGVGLYTYISHKVENVEELDRLSTEIEKSYGTVETYKPYDNEPISISRLESFLLIRDSLMNNSQEFIEAINKMSDSIENEKDSSDNSSFWNVIDIISSGVGIIPHIINHYYEKAYWQREYEMGFGEYYYLYVTCYYSFLKKSPGDGPPFQFADNKGHGIQINDNEDVHFGKEVMEQREIQIRRKVNEMFLHFFGNLLSNGVADKNYEQLVEHELENLRNDKYRLPWENNLPEMLKNILEPYRTRLENSYDKTLNPLEFKNKNDFK